ncbi:MAG: phosphatidylserine decarboxylase [Gemmataceae bacterium]
MRRWYLRRFRPGYVAAMLAKRQGECPTYANDVIDSRDLKFIRPGCGFWFHPTDDAFAYRESLGFARWGYAELVGFSSVLIVAATVFVILALILHWLCWILVAVCGVLLAEVVWFFRDPPRRIPDAPDALVSPADGTVTHVETVNDEPDFPSPTLRVSIFLSVFNVHVNRVPRSGRVTAVRYFRGEYLDARHAECAKRNEQLWIDFEEATSSQPLRVKQVAGAIARRIVCKLKVGDQLTVGDRYGMIKFGSRTDVLIPISRVRAVMVQVGDKVKGGSTVLLRTR